MTRLQRPLAWFGVFCTLLILMAHEVATGQSCVNWTEETFENPSARYDHATAYDSARGVTVLFGGLSETIELYDTWEWDGAQWRYVFAEGPRPLRGHAMAFDSRRGVTVLFGGRYRNNTTAGIWEWDGQFWANRGRVGPVKRWGHAMVFDERRGVTVLFGGTDWIDGELVAYSDTWEWDGTNWTQVSDTGPPGLARHAMAYDSERGVTVLYAGEKLNGRYWQKTRDTWEWDGSNWTLRATDGPLNEAGHAMTYHAAGHAVIMRGAEWPSTWAWNGERWRLLTTSGPSRRFDFSMCYDSQRQRTVLFGGWDIFDETWEFDESGWRQVAAAGPLERAAASMTFDSHRQVAVLFGGGFGQLTYDDTWEWDGQRWQLVSQRDAPRRENHGSVYDSARRLTLVFGGEEDDEWTNLKPPETWGWNGSRWTMLAATGPPSRTALSMAYDSRRAVAVLTGGSGHIQNYDDTWEWDGQTWRQVAAGGIPALSDAAMVFDEHRRVCILFGGITSGGYSGETWQWDGQSWTRVATSGPAPRAGHEMVYDPEYQAIFLFGGRDGTQQMDDTWLWNGAAWSRLNATGPESRVWSAMTFDSIRHEAVLFGGYEGYQSSHRDTWTFHVTRPHLGLTTSCPDGGQASLQWSCATAFGRIAIVFATQTGQVIIPNGPCAGTRLGLGGNQIRLLATLNSDASGNGAVAGAIPRQACGMYLQLVDATTCATSNVARIE